ncbi:MAG: 2-oxoacid:acceptor oxidoreductase family protein [Patescibacteria group bacterium]|nr:2-oxoacid:acceptor oxidoreductase family protein [Patescibacteria group bacterium]
MAKIAEIRLHGLGGQGIVTTAEIIALASWQNSYWAMSFPYFGPERTGQPLTSFVRLNTEKISTREQIKQPDWLIIREEKLLNNPDTFLGAKKAIIIVNSKQTAATLKIKHQQTIYTINASVLAKTLGNEILANLILLGFFGKISNFYSLDNLNKAIEQKFQTKSKQVILLNKEAAKLGYTYETK